MHRELVSRDELVKLVNQRVRGLAKTGACAIAGVLRLRKPDENGCNWEEIALRGNLTDSFRQALSEMKARYNLLDGF